MKLTLKPVLHFVGLTVLVGVCWGAGGQTLPGQTPENRLGQTPDTGLPDSMEGPQNLAGLSTWPAKSAQQIQRAWPDQGRPDRGDSAAQVGAAGDMIGFSHSDGAGSQTITLVNTSKSWMAVYHIDRSGKIRLASSRPIDADFTLQLNATAPLPSDIRKMDIRKMDVRKSGDIKQRGETRKIGGFQH